MANLQRTTEYMNVQDSQKIVQALGLEASKPTPSVEDSLNKILAGLKKLGDRGISFARGESIKAHLAGVASTVEADIADMERSNKIEAANAAKTAAAQQVAAANKIATDAAAGGAK